MPRDDKPSRQIPTNLRLLLILEEIARRGVPQKPSDLVQAIGLPKPTIHRLLQTAEAEEFLQRDLDGRSYAPGPRLRAMAVHTISSQRLRTARLAILQAVAEEIGETCNLAIPEREGMIYLDRVETKWPLRIQLPVGTQVPFHCTASGKMYLSSLNARTLKGFLSARALEPRTDHTITEPEALRRELDRIRKTGHSTDNEEFMDGMTAVAVAVHDGQDRLVATLSAHAPDQRQSLQDLEGHLDVLKRGAAQLTELVTEDH